MNNKENNGAVKTGSVKTIPDKTEANQQQTINQLRQEIRGLNKTIKDLQQKPDLQVVSVMMPRKLVVRTNKYLLDVSRDMGQMVSLSDLVGDALDVYMDADEEDRKNHMKSL